jgi:hypothetical protein
MGLVKLKIDSKKVSSVDIFRKLLTNEKVILFIGVE